MSRYIDADKFAKRVLEVAYPIVHDINSHEKGLTIFGIAQVLDEQATADVRPNVHGEWILDHPSQLWECSNCHEREIRTTDFCPWCGADMRKEVEKYGI